MGQFFRRLNCHENYHCMVHTVYNALLGLCSYSKFGSCPVGGT